MRELLIILAIMALSDVSGAIANPYDGQPPPPGSETPQQGNAPAPEEAPQGTPEQANQDRGQNDDFWSDDRRGSAQAPPMPTESYPNEFQVTEEDNLRNDPPYAPAIGRLFAYSEEKQAEVCSASVVARNMVLTAAHCVYHRASGVRYDYFSFFPGQYGTTSPYGQWSGGVAYFWTEYMNAVEDQEWPYDYALIVFPPRLSDGKDVGDVVGWYSILVNYPQEGQYYSMGYPSGGQFQGQCSGGSCWAFYCWSPFGESDPYEGGWHTIGFGCHTNRGASGGPVLKQYGNSWYVASVNSQMNESPDSPDRLYNVWGPYFNDWMLELYNYASQQSQ